MQGAVEKSVLRTIRGILQTARNTAMPEGEAARRIPFGLAAGVRARVDFRLDTSFYFGTNERELYPHYRRLVRPGAKCFDVGGYRGWTALTFAKLSGGPVVVFEPNPENVTVIKRSAAVSGFEIRIVARLVGDRNTENWTTLDRAAEETFMPDFIKMDIEGGEVAALEGAHRVLRERRPSLVIEVHGEDKEEECLELLRNAGYRPEIVNPRRGLFKENRAGGHNRWLACEGRL